MGVALRLVGWHCGAFIARSFPAGRGTTRHMLFVLLLPFQRILERTNVIEGDLCGLWGARFPSLTNNSK